MITATVESGWGAATHLVSVIPDGLLPFVPVPGTLNVRNDNEARGVSAAGWIPWVDGVHIPWYRGVVDGIDCVVVGVSAEMPAGHRLELIAPVRLRATLGVDNGGKVTVTLR